MNTGNSHHFIGQIGFACFLCLLCSLQLQAQQPRQEDPLAPLFKAKKVKTITGWQANVQPAEQTKAFYREYSSTGNLVFELVYDENGEVVKKYQSFYGQDNRLLKEVWTQEDSDSVVYRYKNNKLTDETWYWGADKSKTRVVHFFDSLGLKVCSVSKNAWGVYVDSFFYEKGKLVQTKNYNEHGQFTSLTDHVYDNKGRLQKTVLQDEKGTVMQVNSKQYWETGPIKSTETVLYGASSKNVAVPPVSASMSENFKYDAQKQLKEIQMSSYTNNELLVNTKITYIYNDAGLPVSQTSLNILTNVKSAVKYTYTFF